MTMPLEGIRVLDLSRVIAGPFCTQLLADYGAEVIKIEDRQGGDPSRLQAPLINGTGSLFYLVNRNKKSLALDLKQEEGKEVLRRLVRESDVLIEQFRPGIMDKLGLGYESLKAENPRLIYCSLSGYGQTGPMSSAPSHDLNFQSLSGMALLNGLPGETPLVPPLTLMALAGGSLYAVAAIMMALFQRTKTGEGQYCDVAILDGSVSMIVSLLAERAGWGSLPRRGEGVLAGGFACYNIYATSDGGYVSLAAVEGKFWNDFCNEMGHPEYAAAQWDPSQQEVIRKSIQEYFRTRTRQEWEKHFSASDICFSPLLNLDEVCQHPQVTARDMITRLENFVSPGHDLCLTGLPIKLSATPGLVKPEFAALGEHSEEIMRGLGYGNEEIAWLQENKVIL